MLRSICINIKREISLSSKKRDFTSRGRFCILDSALTRPPQLTTLADLWSVSIANKCDMFRRPESRDRGVSGARLEMGQAMRAVETCEGNGMVGKRSRTPAMPIQLRVRTTPSENWSASCHERVALLLLENDAQIDSRDLCWHEQRVQIRF